MRKDQDRAKLFTRRAALLAGGQALMFAALVGRMYYLQVIESDHYAMLADDNRINLRLMPPPRGRILDRFGVVLADNLQAYRGDRSRAGRGPEVVARTGSPRSSASTRIT